MDDVEAAIVRHHSLGFAHNDISPADIMFDHSSAAVLIDFDSVLFDGNMFTEV